MEEGGTKLRKEGIEEATGGVNTSRAALAMPILEACTSGVPSLNLVPRPHVPKSGVLNVGLKVLSTALYCRVPVL